MDTTPPSARDPRETLAHASMTMPQMLAVATTIGLNAIDGFDVLSISFASPGIAAEWGIDRAALGIVLSMELVGMGVGSLALGGLADRIGRRPTILGCLAIITAGMFMATTATGVVSLAAWRVLTGIGIGGILAASTAVAAEFSSLRRRHLSVSLMSIGYPLGAVAGGVVAQQLLLHYSWRSIFHFGAFATVCFIPVVILLIPESVAWLAQRRPAGALGRINHTLARLGYSRIDALPEANTPAQRSSVRALLSAPLLATTVLTTLAYFCHVITFYFVLKWIPKIVVDMGFAASAAAGVLVWTNVGGATGGALFGLLTSRLALKTLTIATFLCSAVAVSMLGQSPADLQALSLVSATAGFFGNAGIVGLYAILAQLFPADARATGTGFVIGIGRGGAVLAPIIAGFLFAAGVSLPAVAAIMASGSLLAILAIVPLRMDERS